MKSRYPVKSQYPMNAAALTISVVGGLGGGAAPLPPMLN